MNDTKRGFTTKEMFNVKQIHMDYIKKQRRQIRHLEYFIAGCVGASIALLGVIVHMMVAGPSWTW